MDAFGLDPDLLTRIQSNPGKENNEMATPFQRDRGFTKARRVGRDEEREEYRQEARRMLDDEEPDADFGDMLALVIEYAASDPDRADQLYEAMSSLGQDARGHRAWARDRIARRRTAKDMRANPDRYRGRDEPPEFPGQPHLGGTTTPLDGEDRRRRGAMDRILAYDAVAKGNVDAWARHGFDARYPGVRDRYGR